MIMEFACYASICVFLVRHDRMMKLVLSEDTIKKRMRKNAIDLSAHMINFTIELALLSNAFVGHSQMDINQKLVNRCWTMSSYGLLGAFHIGYSAALRNQFIGILSSIKNLLLRMPFSFSCVSAPVSPAIVVASGDQAF